MGCTGLRLLYHHLIELSSSSKERRHETNVSPATFCKVMRSRTENHMNWYLPKEGSLYKHKKHKPHHTKGEKKKHLFSKEHSLDKPHYIVERMNGCCLNKNCFFSDYTHQSPKGSLPGPPPSWTNRAKGSEPQRCPRTASWVMAEEKAMQSLDLPRAERSNQPIEKKKQNSI